MRKLTIDTVNAADEAFKAALVAGHDIDIIMHLHCTCATPEEFNTYKQLLLRFSNEIRQLSVKFMRAHPEEFTEPPDARIPTAEEEIAGMPSTILPETRRIAHKCDEVLQ